MPAPERCDNCVYARPKNGTLECHRYAPRPGWEGAVWHRVPTDGWCGDYKRA